MFRQGARIRLGIDTPEYPRGTQATVVHKPTKRCDTCPQTYRVQFDDGVEWPFLEAQLMHAYKTFEETIAWAAAKGHSECDIQATIERLLNEGHVFMDEEMRLVPTRELHERAANTTNDKHTHHWRRGSGRSR